MRITGGNLKGWVIPAKFASHVRPSTDRMRESLFNSLIHQVGIEGKTVLDLFSGSGIIAAEFLSRGAEAVVSVDMDGKNIDHQKQMKQLKLLNQWEIVKSDVFKYQTIKQFDIIFADPPYNIANIQQMPSWVNSWLGDDGIFIIEHKPQIQFHEDSILKKDYGSTSCTIFAKNNLIK